LKQWIVKVWLDDSSREECFCSTQREALDLAQGLMSEYQARISYLAITNADGTFEVVIDRRAHLHTAPSLVM
jgi:hypothetical protein